jgi:hypothetical protein
MKAPGPQIRASSSTAKVLAARLGLACLFTLSGCTAWQVKLGMKVYLAQTPVSSVEIRLPKGPAIAPGQKSPLVVAVTEPNGKVLLTEGQGGGKVIWKDLQVQATVVSVNNKGIVSLGRDPRISDGKVGHITVTAVSHPDLRADLDIPFRYNINYVSNFPGASGSSGFNGTDGISGTSGSPGSFDPNNPSAGGNGTDGGNGSDGQDGGSGGDAPPVDVRVTVQPGSHPLLQASVSALGQQELYLIDPHGGSLTVRADGGSGGSGGRGGRGGQGGAGGMGMPNGSSGSSGMDGRNGSDGSAGRGGRITVTYDPQVEPFLGVIHLSYFNGPSPVFNEEQVAPLW